MILREWRGETPRDKAEAYGRYMVEVALPEFQATPGNLGAMLLRRDEEARSSFTFLSLWESWDAIHRFAGRDVRRAVYYPRDPEFLLALAPHVDHHEVVAALAGPGGTGLQSQEHG